MLFSTNIFIKHLNISEIPYSFVTDGRYKKKRRKKNEKKKKAFICTLALILVSRHLDNRVSLNCDVNLDVIRV